MVYQLIDPKMVVPPHEVKNEKKLRQLVRTMEDHGWIGEPLPCLWNGEQYIALTGSHRIAAAKVAEIDVLIYTIDITEHKSMDSGGCIVCGDDCWVAKLYWASRDEDRLEAAMDSGDTELIRLLEAEIAKNYEHDHIT